MKDPEFILLRNRTILAVSVCIILLTPFFLFFFNKLNQDDSKLMREIKEKRTDYIYINNQYTSDKFHKALKKENLHYYRINIDKSRDYEKIIRSLDITNDDIVPPSVIYIKEGQIVSILNNIQKEEDIKTFLENYKGGE